MILVIKGKKFDLEPHQLVVAWLLVPSSDIQIFRDLGVPLISLEDGVTVLKKADLLKRLGQGS